MYLLEQAKKGGIKDHVFSSKSPGKGSKDTSSPPKPPPRAHQRRERPAIDLDAVKLVAASLNVRHEKQIAALFEQHIALTTELDSVHGKASGYHAAIEKERRRRQDLQAQLEHCQSMLPQCQSHKAAQDAQIRVVDGALAVAASESTQLKRTLADARAAAKALDASAEQTHACLQSQAGLAIDVQDLRHQLDAATAQLAAAKQHLRQTQLQHDTALVDLAQQTADEATKLRSLHMELGQSSQTCQDVAQFVARCTREYVDRTGCPLT